MRPPRQFTIIVNGCGGVRTSHMRVRVCRSRDSRLFESEHGGNMWKLIRGGISGIAALVAALFVVVIGVQPAHAGWYNYLVGHPMYKGTSPWCTGSYVIYGTSGTFILTAGHCFYVGERVSGTGAGFGTLAYRKAYSTDGDSGLVRADPGVDMYQTIVDPTTGNAPGSGQVTGKMPNSEQTVLTRVGKMGNTTGWTEGTIQYRYQNWDGVTAYCADYARAGGDSGGPVWRQDSQGLRAVGMHVGAINYYGSTLGCYIPIDTLLSQWGASMNFWPSYAARGAVAEEELLPPSPSKELPPVLTAADGVELIRD
ncbi:trypsin-like serine protease [Paenarthrobacter sp. NyZ202]|uniref:trypsin-like serine protease n=1 Tax=Paenarthrobacter sp. NyZ202 TaxID=3402689 RepID=UPI003CF2505C